MGESLASFTSLPNLHPALVHFPIALLPMAAIFDLLFLLLSGQRTWLDRAAAVVYTATALGTGAAYWAGARAGDSLTGGLSPRLQVHVGEHSDWALYAIWLIAILAAFRVGLTLWDRQTTRVATRGALLLVALVAVAVVFKTADLGGGLVYKHRIAVAAEVSPMPETLVEGSDAQAASRPEDRLTRLDDGSLDWIPEPGDREALGSLLRAAPGGDLEAVAWAEPTAGEARGLALRVAGRALLLLPEEYEDVQVEAALELESFEGTVGLVHHARSVEEAGLFQVAVPSGAMSLSTISAGGEEILGRASIDLPSESVRLAVFAAGRHFRGMLDDEVVVHGHQSALPAGGCGLLVDGSGTIRIVSLRVIPITD
ncbi:MAG: DUF2231 domain-containing protein [Thermoanaerobaculia bacterium]